MSSHSQSGKLSGESFVTVSPDVKFELQGTSKSASPYFDEFDEDYTLFIPEAKKTSISYKFDEDKILEEIKEYIDSTYRSHYAQGEFQAFEVIKDAGHGLGFAIGDIIKYILRLGKKDGFNRKDVLKIIHYGVLLLHTLDTEVNSKVGR